MSGSNESGYLRAQTDAFAVEAGKGMYNATRTVSGENRDFFLRTISAMTPGWAGAGELRVLECGVGDGVWLDVLREGRKHGSTQVNGFDLTPELVQLAA